MNLAAYIGITVVIYYLIPDALFKAEWQLRVAWGFWIFAGFIVALRADLAPSPPTGHGQK